LPNTRTTLLSFTSALITRDFGILDTQAAIESDQHPTDKESIHQMKNPMNPVVQRGWKIFPLIHRSRFATEQPMLSSATSSIEKIEAWQQQFPDCPWAVATGAESGIFAVEFSRDIGIESMRSHCSGDYSGMDTLQIRTPKQVTMFFRWPNSGLPASRREQIADGIVVRHAGGCTGLPAEADGANGQLTYCNLTAEVLNAPIWLLELIHQTFGKQLPNEVIPFPPAKTSTRLVGMSFANRDYRWVCDFYSIEGEGMLIKTLLFRSGNAILILAERGGVAMSAENKEWLDSRIQRGAGIVLLTLTSEQYEKLMAA
jgi:Bifunctional DNA primase/polymerase, N-terminal